MSIFFRLISINFFKILRKKNVLLRIFFYFFAEMPLSANLFRLESSIQKLVLIRIIPQNKNKIYIFLIFQIDMKDRQSAE